MAGMVIMNKKTKSRKSTRSRKKRGARRNPVNSKLSLMMLAMDSATEIGGAVAINAAVGLIPLPAKIEKFKGVISLLAGLITGWGLVKMKMPTAGKNIARGVVTVQGYKYASMMINRVKPGLLGLGEDDDLESLLGEAEGLLGKNNNLIGLNAYSSVGAGAPINRMSVADPSTNVTSMMKAVGSEAKKKALMSGLSEYSYEY